MEVSTKNIIYIGLGVIAIATATSITSAIIKKRRFEQGKKERDQNFNPNREIMVAYVGDSGYSNVRSTPTLPEKSTVDTIVSLATFGYGSINQNEANLLGKVTGSNPIGTVVSEQKDDRGIYWYKLKLSQSLSGKDYGWVREDVVNIKIEKK